MEEAGYIFPYHIKFKVDQTAGQDRLDICVFESIGDDSDVEFRLFYIEDGEAGAIEADGAFFDDEVCEFFGEFEAVFPATFFVIAFETGGCGVDMALDDMSVEAAVYDQASFEVDEIAGLPGIEGGLFKRLSDGCYAVELAFCFFDREADAVMG